MNGLFVVGAREKEKAHRHSEDSRHGAGIIALIDGNGRVSLVKEYVSPPEVCSEDPGILFKAATLQGDMLYGCTETEVFAWRLPDFQMVHYRSLPCFNDVHHVRPYGEGNLLVACTGLDMVAMLDPEGRVVREWDALGEKLWERFTSSVDYRKVKSTKPHKSHPNYVFCLGEDIWTTRFHQRDAICLTGPGKRIDIGIQRPHDGVIRGSSIYFTTVDGHVVVADTDTLQTKQVIPLGEMSPSGDVLGWCRGIEILDQERFIVGFTRLRPTKFVENVQWVKSQLGLRSDSKIMPTRIAAYNLNLRKLEWEIDLEPYGMNAVFSIHAVPEHLRPAMQ